MQSDCPIIEKGNVINGLAVWLPMMDAFRTVSLQMQNLAAH
jgi:hypothetical protein